MRQVLASMAVLVALSGCGVLPGAVQTPSGAGAMPGEGQIRPRARPAGLNTNVTPVSANARTVEEFDTTTVAERAEAASGSEAAGADLGLTVASLGAAAEPGFWLKTPLVDTPARGRVVYPATGQSVDVDLIPLPGPKTGGSRMSLAAMRLIGASLTGLPELRVYRFGGF